MTRPFLQSEGFLIFEKFHEIPIDMAGMFLYPIHTKENVIYGKQHNQDNQEKMESVQTFP